MYKTESKFLFPKQIIVCDNHDYSSFKDELISFCYSEKKLDTNGVLRSNIGGWQSSNSYLHNYKKFSKFYEELSSQLNYCLFKEFNFTENITLGINDLWINISTKGNYNMLHKHPLSIYSGVFYVKCHNDCGNIVFQEDECDTIDVEFRTEEFRNKHLMYPAYFFKPKEGRMILFPSNLNHRVEFNDSDEDRISIAFNCLIPS